MKSLLYLSIILMAFSLHAFGQVSISARLTDALENSTEGDYVRGFIILADQVDLMQLDQRLYDEKASLQQRAYEVISALQQKASETQEAILPYFEIEHASRNIYSYKSYWIFNGFLIEARPQVYYELIKRTDIAYMDLDAELEYHEPVETKIVDSKSPGVELGVQLIKAPLLWKMGITGAGSIVMGDDTGVYYTHEALNDQWHGNFVPDSQAWFDPYEGSVLPEDCMGHGTHTMGTMCGVSPDGDTIGVAPDAHWIASKSLCDVSNTSDHVDSWQWALDPDGNPATQDDMPDVICNSWQDPDIDDECGGVYVNLMNAMEAAGIAIVFSAGNQGPNTSTITPPHNINTNIVNAFTTGAIDGALYNGGSYDPIADFSSRGPSNCGGTGSLLIKPEVSAPGVDVLSAWYLHNQNYRLSSGTSMAAPHIAGAVALLRQYAPQLTGKQILEAIYLSATDLGINGEDNNYGTGLINVYDALLYLGSPETIPPNPVNDLAAIDQNSTEIVLQWTVPFDASVGGVTKYDLRMSSSPITDTTAFNNAQKINTPIPKVIGATETFVVTGLDHNSTYHFNLRCCDMWGNRSDLSNPVNGTTWGPPQITVSPQNMVRGMQPLSDAVDTIFIGNTSYMPSSLHYNIELLNNTFPEGSIKMRMISVDNQTDKPISNSKQTGNVSSDNNGSGGYLTERSGGPDNYGYTWVDQTEPDGPVYAWNDIAGSGTLVTNWIPTGTYAADDEGYIGPIPLGFEFIFYGDVKNEIYISTNGLILFNQPEADTYDNYNIPNDNVPDEFIAPFWDDLKQGAIGRVFYLAGEDSFTVQFTNWGFSSNNDINTWQVVLRSDGKIRFYYKAINRISLYATIGIENANGDDGLQISYNTNFIDDYDAFEIKASPNWLLLPEEYSGKLVNGNNTAVELTYRSSSYPKGIYTMDVTVNSNDPIQPAITIPVKLTVNDLLSLYLDHHQNWNIFSLPVEASHQSVDSLFPNRTSQVFHFSQANNNSYMIVNTMESGKAYWIKFDEADSTEISGIKPFDTLVTVASGWNMIGGFDYPVNTASITSIPEGIIESAFFGFQAGYHIAPVIEEGRGFWVKCSQSGQLVLPKNTTTKNVQPFIPENEWIAVTIRDKAGNTSTLYLTENGVENTFAELPPVPPELIFDARFSDNTFISDASGGSMITMQSNHYPLTVSVSGGNLQFTDVASGKLINKQITDGETLTITNPSINRLHVYSVEIPTTYALFQNYPNPFNPSTTIKFALPESGKVSLEIYDQLGQKVETLINEEYQAGYHEYEWKAIQYSTGVYFYVIKSGGYKAVKKMLLLK